MSLAALMRRGTISSSGSAMTATLATPATLEGDPGATVATVATVTVTDPRRLWLVRHPEGWISHAFEPPITEEEVREWYPDAEDVVVEEEPVVVITEEDVVEEDVEVVVCATCDAFERNPINPVGGLGRCRVDAPASRKAGSLWPWPDAAIRCGEYPAHGRAGAVS